MEKKYWCGLEQVSVRLVKNAPLLSNKMINAPEDVVELLADTFCEYDREVIGVVHFTSDNRPINCSVVSIGTLNYVVSHPRELLKAAFLCNAASIMLFHNHPSGNVTPSKDDIRITDRLARICELTGIELLDHVIIGSNSENYYSFKNKDQISVANIGYAETLYNINLWAAER